jgi:hypothetical protein
MKLPLGFAFVCAISACQPAPGRAEKKEAPAVSQARLTERSAQPSRSRVTRTVDTRSFGLWRMPPELYGTPISHFNAPVNFTTLPLNRSNAKAALDRAQAHGTRLIISFQARPQRRDEAFSFQTWKRRIDAFCSTKSTGTTDCFDFDPYIRDGTIVVANLFETNAAPDDEPGRAATLAQIQQAAAYVKTRWPNLVTAVDGSHPCNLALPGIQWSEHDLNLVIINVFSGASRPPAAMKNIIDSGIRCAKRAGLDYIVDVNPFGRARTEGLAPGGIASFETATKHAILSPGSLGIIIWRWWPQSGRTVTNGVKEFPNFWNEEINPGISAAMRRIHQCAALRTNPACS